MTHRITVCTSCRLKGTATRPGKELILHLRTALAETRDEMPERYAVGGASCMAGCDHSCTVAFQAPRKASYLFGDIDPSEDLGDLLAFARDYALLSDGWCSSVDRPSKLRKSTLARVPALQSANQ
ncbi:MAG: DUF1636 domain-containing protein [Tateyamaria sp.]|uniref:DUF1636 family protein n=1 Tax=Tateyamaria sp. TaxID=1929288 RepID=UPI0032799AB8